MSELNELQTDSAVVAELATRAQDFTEVDPNGLPTFVLDQAGDPNLVDVEDFRDHPRRTRAHRGFGDVASLLAYLQRHDPRPMAVDSEGNTALGYPPRVGPRSDEVDPDELPTTIWANEGTRSLVAVLDDDTLGAPGWGQHRATLTLERDEDWMKWVNRNGQLMSQEVAAEHIEDLVHTVVEPDAADLLEIVSTLQVHRQMVVGKAIRLSSGETQIQYSEDDTATAGRQATLTVPNRINLLVPIFVGAEPTAVSARFRYRQVGRELKVAYVIDRLRLVERGAFAAVVQVVADAGRPVLFGTP